MDRQRGREGQREQEMAMNRLKPVQGRPGEDCLLCADSVLSFKSYL